MHPALAALRKDAWQGLPYALLLAIALGGVLVVGVNLSNAFPSESRPFGWEGTSPLWNGVATVRSDLVIATSLPPLLWGVAALRAREPSVERTARVAGAFGAHAVMIALAVLLAVSVGAIAASKVHSRAFLALWSASTILALSFYALAFLCGALARRWALPLAGLVWLVFHAAYENITRIGAFRQAGYFELAAGNFPSWFYVAQAFSPLSAYRGVLILWERGFMDYLESATLGKAALPAWVNPGTFAALGLGLWVLLPFGLACLAWWWQGRAAAAPATKAEPA